jgi:anti-sigma factor RsiW
MIAARVRFAVDHRWAQRRMSDALDGQLADRARDRLARHEAECPECRELLHSLRRLLTFLEDAAGWDAGERAPELAAAVTARLHETA